MLRSPLPGHAAGTVDVAGRTVHRMGLGTLQFTGPGHWGPPRDPDAAVAVLRRAVELGVDFIDTADSYGPHVSEELVARALHPYPEHVLVATKAGFVRTGPDVWVPLGRPEFLRQQAELSLRRLQLDFIPLFQLHRVDPAVPFADQVGTLKELRDEGKIAAVGLSQVRVPELEQARQIVPIASVQNWFNLRHRHTESVLEYAQAHGITFVPWFPIEAGGLAAAGDGDPLGRIARDLSATPVQVALAWLLMRSPVVLPIPGTSRVAHLEQNVAAAALCLDAAQFAALDELGWR